MANQRTKFDQAADELGLDLDQRASLLVLHEDPYLKWLESGHGLEISRRRLVEITDVLLLLATVHSPESARSWLYSPDQNMRSRVPAAVLRVGKVDEVRDHVEAMGGFT